LTDALLRPLAETTGLRIFLLPLDSFYNQGVTSTQQSIQTHLEETERIQNARGVL